MRLEWNTKFCISKFFKGKSSCQVTKQSYANTYYLSCNGLSIYRIFRREVVKNISQKPWEYLLLSTSLDSHSKMLISMQSVPSCFCFLHICSFPKGVAKVGGLEGVFHFLCQFSSICKQCRNQVQFQSSLMFPFFLLGTRWKTDESEFISDKP